jgi:hypothetical protein
MRVSLATGLCINVVFRDEIEDQVARLVQGRAAGSYMVLCVVDTSDGMWALVEGVVSPCGSTVVTWRRQL